MYRPIGLAPVGTSNVHAGRASTYADRRRAAADRLQLAETLTTRLDAAVPADLAATDGSPIDPDGVLRACIRALIPLAQRGTGTAPGGLAPAAPDPARPAAGRPDPTRPAATGPELMVSIGPDHAWAARLSQGPDGLSVDLVPGPGRPGVPDRPPTPTEAGVATELATWLWSGAVNGL